MAEQAGDKSLSGGIKKWFAFLPGDTPPRIFLIYFSVLLQLIALAISGTGYATGETTYWLAGMLLWLLWFFIMFLIVIPHMDKLLQRYRGWLKPVARTILIVLLIAGIAEGGLLGLFAPGYITSGASNDLVRRSKNWTGDSNITTAPLLFNRERKTSSTARTLTLMGIL